MAGGRPLTGTEVCHVKGLYKRCHAALSPSFIASSQVAALTTRLQGQVLVVSPARQTLHWLLPISTGFARGMDRVCTRNNLEPLGLGCSLGEGELS